jgi:hypothetical protein
MLRLQHLLALATVAAATAFASPVIAAAPGACGTYMYWSNGRCVDARAKRGKPWAEELMAKPWKG